MASGKIYYGIKSLMVSALMIFSALKVDGQSKKTVIKNIRETVQNINKNKTLKTIKLENEEVSEEVPDEGISLTGYVNDKTIYKIDYWVGLSFCIRQYSFYFDKSNRPVFIYETEQDFPEDNQGGLDHTKTVPAFEGRYYLNNGKLIDTRLKGKKRMEGNPTANDIEALISNATSGVKLIRARLKSK